MDSNAVDSNVVDEGPQSPPAPLVHPYPKHFPARNFVSALYRTCLSLTEALTQSTTHFRPSSVTHSLHFNQSASHSLHPLSHSVTQSLSHFTHSVTQSLHSVTQVTHFTHSLTVAVEVVTDRDRKVGLGNGGIDADDAVRGDRLHAGCRRDLARGGVWRLGRGGHEGRGEGGRDGRGRRSLVISPFFGYCHDHLGLVGFEIAGG